MTDAVAEHGRATAMGLSVWWKAGTALPHAVPLSFAMGRRLTRTRETGFGGVL